MSEEVDSNELRLIADDLDLTNSYPALELRVAADAIDRLTAERDAMSVAIREALGEVWDRPLTEPMTPEQIRIAVDDLYEQRDALSAKLAEWKVSHAAAEGQIGGLCMENDRLRAKLAECEADIHALRALLTAFTIPPSDELRKAFEEGAKAMQERAAKRCEDVSEGLRLELYDPAGARPSLRRTAAIEGGREACKFVVDDIRAIDPTTLKGKDRE